MEDTGTTLPHIGIDEERCVSCRECLEICPQTRGAEYPVYVWGENGYPQVANPESCIGCLTCQVGCRARAIAVRLKESAGWRISGDPRAEMKCRAIF